MRNFLPSLYARFKKWFLHHLRHDFSFWDCLGDVFFFRYFTTKTRVKVGFALSALFVLVACMESAFDVSFDLTRFLLVYFAFYPFCAFPITTSFFMSAAYVSFVWAYICLIQLSFRLFEWLGWV